MQARAVDSSPAGSSLNFSIELQAIHCIPSYSWFPHLLKESLNKQRPPRVEARTAPSTSAFYRAWFSAFQPPPGRWLIAGGTGFIHHILPFPIVPPPRCHGTSILVVPCPHVDAQSPLMFLANRYKEMLHTHTLIFLQGQGSDAAQREAQARRTRPKPIQTTRHSLTTVFVHC